MASHAPAERPFGDAVIPYRMTPAPHGLWDRGSLHSALMVAIGSFRVREPFHPNGFRTARWPR